MYIDIYIYMSFVLAYANFGIPLLNKHFSIYKVDKFQFNCKIILILPILEYFRAIHIEFLG